MTGERAALIDAVRNRSVFGASSKRTKQYAQEMGSYGDDNMMSASGDNRHTPHGTTSDRAGRRHRHLEDVGFGSLASYFFCLVIAGFIRSEGIATDMANDSFLILLLTFMGATCLSLLFLAIIGPYILRHDNQKLLALLSALLLMCGPLFCVVEHVSGIFFLPLGFFLFSLSGCGYALCILIWGRILSIKEPGKSSLQVATDICASIIVVVLVSALPKAVSFLIIAGFGLTAGLIGFRRAVSAKSGIDSDEQIVVSDTRTAIPLASCFAGGILWMAYGISLVLLWGVYVLSETLNIAMIAVLVLAAIACIAIVRLHRRPGINLSRIYWATVPLIVVGLAIYVSGEQQLQCLAVVLVVLSMITSYLHLMSHFAALANRPDILSDQLFCWGWLAPFAGIFIGIFAGIGFQLVENPILSLVLPVITGVLVLTLIITMHSIDKATVKRRNREATMEQTAEQVTVDHESHIDDVLSEIGLSTREREVASLILQGRSQAVIANQLFVAISTVNTHVKHIYRKAGVRSKQEFIDLIQQKLQVHDQRTAERG